MGKMPAPFVGKDMHFPAVGPPEINQHLPVVFVRDNVIVRAESRDRDHTFLHGRPQCVRGFG